MESQDPATTTLAYIKAKLPEEKEDMLRRHFGGLGVGAQMNQSIKTLSGGESVRVATGLATWNNPHLLVLDEVSFAWRCALFLTNLP